jgi:hypothetical protein
MKVFLSWSGEQSKLAAKALHDWLPPVIQTVRPYMSAENINKGQRWSLDLSKQLEETNFGVICVTPENLEAPWVLFEAGALSKSIEKGHVSPLLFGLGASDLADSPLLQFQATTFRKDDFRMLLHSMNAAAPEAERLTTEVLNRSFERAWAELEQEIGKIDFAAPKRSGKARHEKPPEEKMEQVLDELLSIARSQMKLLRSPEDMLPVAYLRTALDDASGPDHLWHERITLLRAAFDNIESQTDRIAEMLAAAEPLKTGAMHHVQHNVAFLKDYIRAVRNEYGLGRKSAYAEELRHLIKSLPTGAIDFNTVMEIFRASEHGTEQKKS